MAVTRHPISTRTGRSPELAWGCPGSGIPSEIVAAVDVNTVANEVYMHNFPTTPLWPKTIEGISLKEFNRLCFDMILMSPPCQPFTRIGRQGDISDPRTRSFLYILDILPRLTKLPKYVLLENVKGFETSTARDELIQTLEKCGFTYQEFLLSPTCLGIPNSRLRYFLIARNPSEPFTFQVPGKILTDFPTVEPVDSKMSKGSTCLEEDKSQVPTKKPASASSNNAKWCQPKENFIFKLETAEELERKQQSDNDLTLQMLKDFLQIDEGGLSQYFLPPKSLLRYAFLLDIVTPTCRRSTCFTKGYGHYIEGTGSVLQTAEDIQLETVFKSFEALSEEEKLMKLSTLKLRYFTPREIANLHGFPPEFGFPDKITTKQCYRLLGNSLNVHVVAKLISILVG
ncbi:tRNA (cytosine(38)-C(5))-methyltransferase isoform X2 [Hemicordylus capensis]|uniref:tRNA (cytosine(38)-C(5))-methyltransferase isoform X2 n=1 Tax=Hemicordylus capensis TaxID=884348 RepID=UPI0023049D8F|nr:tRNA (cytosine(38)-C(5))-methyltransferase isoform X2 [Hemicordylus capensis]